MRLLVGAPTHAIVVSVAGLHERPTMKMTNIHNSDSRDALAVCYAVAVSLAGLHEGPADAAGAAQCSAECHCA
jgi:hypothetical protein